jgi:hypothetical protein
MVKVVINRCFGGFGLSEKALSCLGLDNDYERYKKEFRSSLKLIKCIEMLGGEANGPHAELAIVEIPDDVNWGIEEYDGMEHIAEVHRTWH